MVGRAAGEDHTIVAVADTSYIHGFLGQANHRTSAMSSEPGLPPSRASLATAR
jgi:hypothetical protein